MHRRCPVIVTESGSDGSVGDGGNGSDTNTMVAGSAIMAATATTPASADPMDTKAAPSCSSNESVGAPSVRTNLSQHAAHSGDP